MLVPPANSTMRPHMRILVGVAEHIWATIAEFHVGLWFRPSLHPPSDISEMLRVEIRQGMCAVNVAGCLTERQSAGEMLFQRLCIVIDDENWDACLLYLRHQRSTAVVPGGQCDQKVGFQAQHTFDAERVLLGIPDVRESREARNHRLIAHPACAAIVLPLVAVETNESAPQPTAPAIAVNSSKLKPITMRSAGAFSTTLRPSASVMGGMAARTRPGRAATSGRIMKARRVMVAFITMAPIGLVGPASSGPSRFLRCHRQELFVVATQLRHRIDVAEPVRIELFRNEICGGVVEQGTAKSMLDREELAIADGGELRPALALCIRREPRACGGDVGIEAGQDPHQAGQPTTSQR